eukprot:TRINITY_DN9457_c0_g10_i1.p1 TRINITY_DN9457_c0_g10~~TRINITY_DN9457_c0_g10_i1.p1  ORF type:complete len:814 (+),score=239.91 TRINITY_DN9457_c0_g10_i1:70-2511(+)
MGGQRGGDGGGFCPTSVDPLLKYGVPSPAVLDSCSPRRSPTRRPVPAPPPPQRSPQREPRQRPRPCSKTAVAELFLGGPKRPPAPQLEPRHAAPPSVRVELTAAITSCREARRAHCGALQRLRQEIASGKRDSRRLPGLIVEAEAEEERAARAERRLKNDLVRRSQLAASIKHLNDCLAFHTQAVAALTQQLAELKAVRMHPYERARQHKWADKGAAQANFETQVMCFRRLKIFQQERRTKRGLTLCAEQTLLCCGVGLRRTYYDRLQRYAMRRRMLKETMVHVERMAAVQARLLRVTYFRSLTRWGERQGRQRRLLHAADSISRASVFRLMRESWHRLLANIEQQSASRQRVQLINVLGYNTTLVLMRCAFKRLRAWVERKRMVSMAAGLAAHWESGLRKVAWRKLLGNVARQQQRRRRNHRAEVLMAGTTRGLYVIYYHRLLRFSDQGKRRRECDMHILALQAHQNCQLRRTYWVALEICALERMCKRFMDAVAMGAEYSRIMWAEESAHRQLVVEAEAARRGVAERQLRRLLHTLGRTGSIGFTVTAAWDKRMQMHMTSSSGILIKNVLPMGPAATAGVQEGDVVVSVVNPKGLCALRSVKDFIVNTGSLSNVFEGTSITLNIWRCPQIAARSTAEPQEKRGGNKAQAAQKKSGGRALNIPVTMGPMLQAVRMSKVRALQRSLSIHFTNVDADQVFTLLHDPLAFKDDLRSFANEMVDDEEGSEWVTEASRLPDLVKKFAQKLGLPNPPVSKWEELYTEAQLLDDDDYDEEDDDWDQRLSFDQVFLYLWDMFISMLFGSVLEALTESTAA